MGMSQETVALVTLFYSFTEKNCFILLAINSLKCSSFVSQEIFKSKFPKIHKKMYTQFEIIFEMYSKMFYVIFSCLVPSTIHFQFNRQYLLKELCLVSHYFYFFTPVQLGDFLMIEQLYQSMLLCNVYYENIILFFFLKCSKRC